MFTSKQIVHVSLKTLLLIHLMIISTSVYHIIYVKILHVMKMMGGKHPFKKKTKQSKFGDVMMQFRSVAWSRWFQNKNKHHPREKLFVILLSCSAVKPWTLLHSEWHTATEQCLWCPWWQEVVWSGCTLGILMKKQA